MSIHIKSRGSGFGLDADLQKASLEKYSLNMEQQARKWIEEIAEMQLGEDFGMGLKDGIALCKVANAIEPNCIKKIETSKMPFKQMENISNFLKAIRKIGVLEYEVFETVDLFDLKDMGLVIRCIFALGRATQKNYPEFTGPALGVKESKSNPRSFSEKQLLESKNSVSKLNLGSSGTMERGEISKASNVTFGHDASSPPMEASSDDNEELLDITSSMDDIVATKDESVIIEDATDDKVPGTSTANGVSECDIESTANSVVEMEATMEEDDMQSKNIGENSSTTDNVNTLPAKSPSKRMDHEKEAQQWMEAILQVQFPTSFGESLRDGVFLCKLINCIVPGTIPRVSTSKMPFQQMENVTQFIKSCRAIGVAEFDLFETVDLYQLKDIRSVVRCIHALGRNIQKTVPSFSGPKLGKREATVNRRSFSPEQHQTSSHVAKLNLGSSQVMERLPISHAKSVTFGAQQDSYSTKMAPVPTTETISQPSPVLSTPSKAGSPSPTYRTVWKE